MNAFMTLAEVATKLVAALQPLAAGVITLTPIEAVGRGEYYDPQPRGNDTEDNAARKLLEAVYSSSDIGGGFHITIA